MIVVGLTGSIGMGKTTTARQFGRLGARVFNADECVRELMAEGGAGAARVAEAFPEIMRGGVFDKRALTERVFRDAESLTMLENVLHPLVRDGEAKFLARAQQSKCRVAVLDIPLLFETGAENRVDVTVVVTAPKFIQKQRVMRRARMNEKRFAAIIARQMPDNEKQLRADYVVNTGLGKAYSFRQVQRIMKELAGA